MKNSVFFISMFYLSISLNTTGQITEPDLTKINDHESWTVFNRSIKINQEQAEAFVSFDARQGDGMAIFQNLEFENGVIEFDVKGKNVFQQSFVGVAFHFQDEDSFNAVYFRPFNFNNEDSVRKGHSVQYISHPEFTWQKLRSLFPEQFENPVNPIPDPEQFFHARIEVNWPLVKVFVNNSDDPCLEVQMKSTFKTGKVGFWVGNGSDGTFKNLAITR